MKKYFSTIILIILFLITVPLANASDSNKESQKFNHSKPSSDFDKKNLQSDFENLADSRDKRGFLSETKTDSDLSEPFFSGDLKNLLSIKKDRELQSLADPLLLDLDYYNSYVIAAAVAKDPDNYAIQRSGYNPLFLFYDSRGNLDYVQDNLGNDLAWIYYCDGSESYYCPLDWVDWITFDPNNISYDLEFFYEPSSTQDKPDKVYTAEMTGEPDLFFYNINQADGSSVTNNTDSLYAGDISPQIAINKSQITGYINGVTPIDPDWHLYFDNFSNQRLTLIGNTDNSKKATLFQSTSRSIYRFWSDDKQHHFFTMSKPEKNYVVNSYNDSTWKFENVSSKAFATQEAGTTPIYRFWSDTKQGHFYTSSESEKNYVINNYDDSVWKYENIAYYVYNAPDTGRTPIYRFWSDTKQGHFYTSSESEKNYIIATYPEKTWKYEIIAWYVPE